MRERQKPFAFISYRQGDALPHARALHERMLAVFGSKSAFLDFRSVAAGEAWKPAIETACKNATVVLAVIGPAWLQSLQLMKSLPVEKDWVRKELLCADRRKLPVVPIAVAGASLPRPDELPSELIHTASWQGLELRERAFDRDVDFLLSQLEKQHGFKRVWRPPSALFFLLGFLVVFLASLFVAWKLELTVLTTVPLAVFVCFAVAVTWTFVGPLLGVDQEELPPDLLSARSTIARIATLVVSLSLLALWTSLFLGFPVDMRDRLNPKLVARTGFPDFASSTIPTPISNAFPRPQGAGQGLQTETLVQMARFKHWIADGAEEGGKRAFVYRFKPVKPDYYKPFDGHLEFPNLTGLAQLVEGAAFLTRDGDDPVDWRQLKLWLNDKNPTNVPPKPTLENKLQSVVMDPGDTLMLILAFQHVPGKQKELGKAKLDDFGAKLTRDN